MGDFMIIADLPPAAPAPKDPCSQMPALELHVMCTSVITSPDGRWKLVVLGDDNQTAKIQGLYLPKGRDPRGFLFDTRSHRVVYKFEMERSAQAHWLKDGRTLVVNYYAGSDSTRPLAMRLSHSGGAKPRDLSTLVYADVLKRIRKNNSQVYHYYVRFLSDQGSRITIAAEPEFVKHGEHGEGDGRCYLYSVDKATFRHYRFVKALSDETCPGNADEDWTWTGFDAAP